MTTKPFPRARLTDPETSHSAAEQANALAVQHYEKILSCLQRFGALGKDGIAKHSGLEANQVARRMSELHRLGQIELTERLVKSNSNRLEREWRICPVQLNLL
jgi:hypothetical protein